MTIRCLVVDDEPLGRERIASLLRTQPDAEIIGLCANGSEAIDMIDALAPDLVFLDVQMPEVDGFGVLAAIRPTKLPAVVFVTAYAEYAIRAFEVHAQDYLLKPFDPDRLFAAYRRAAERIRLKQLEPANSQLLALVSDMARQRTRRTRVPIKTDGRVTLLPVADIDWIESSDNHVKIHAKGQVHLVRQTLQGMDDSLPLDDFIRVHRSAIINVARIREIQPWFTGEYVVILHDGTQVRTSRGYRARLESLIS